MEIRVLKYFLMVAQEENMTRAADLLHITQPTLSRQITQLEEELGCKLFRRNSHGIFLTDSGKLLKTRAQDILELEERTRKELVREEETINGEIVFGSGETNGFYKMTDVIADFQKAYPEVRYHVYTANADDIKEKLDQGLVDFGILTEPVDISRYNFRRLEEKEIWGLLDRRDSGRNRKEKITAKELTSVPLILVGRELVKHELAGWFGEYYNQLHIVGTYNLINNAAALVEKGIGAALCMNLKQIQNEQLHFIPLYPPVTTGSVLVWRKNQRLSSTARYFLEYFNERYA